MAKSWTDRARALIKTEYPRAADIEALIAAAEADLKTANADIEIYRAVAESIEATDSEAKEAAAKLGEAEFTARRYAAMLTQLQDKLVAIRDNEKRKAAQDEMDAATAERDALVAEWQGIPKVVERLTDLFARTKFNDARIEKASLGDRIDSAEAIGRDIPGNFYIGDGPALRFTSLKIPQWQGTEYQWPPRAPQYDYRASLLRQREDAAEREARQEAQWGHYQFSQSTGKMIIFNERGRDNLPSKRGLGSDHVWTGQASHDEADRLRDLGVTVAAIDPEQNSGSSPAAAASAA